VAYDLTGRALRPLGELLAVADLPLAEFLPPELLQATFDRVYFTEADASFLEDNLVLTVRLAIEAEIALAPPGTDAVQLVLCSGGPGWTSILAEIVLGPDFSITLREVTVGLRVAKEILEDAATHQPAEISVTADIRFSPSGIEVSNGTGAALPPAKLCGTNIIVEAQDVRPVFGAIEPPDFLLDQPDFQGIALTQLKVKLPDEIHSDAGSEIDITLTNAAIGTTGFTGQVKVDTPPGNPKTGTILGFPFRFRQFTLDIQQNAFVDVSFGADVRLATFEENGGPPKWVAFDFAFGADGALSGALAGAQPAGASAAADALVQFEFTQVIRFDITKVRVTKTSAGVWAFYFSGDAEVLLQGAVSWPKVAFDEIGVDSTGELLMPDGAGIAFATPLVVDWHFVRLTVPKFRLGHADDKRAIAERRFRLALSAEVVLHESVPAGASVEGLVVEWKPGDDPSVSFSGIGVTFGVPGSFQATVAVAYVNANGVVEFRGNGKLELTSLEASVEVGMVIGRQPVDELHPEPFNYLYVFADAKVLPTGIPIGSTGLCIYGFQGLVARNMALKVDTDLPVDERYYALFKQPPTGIASLDKWKRSFGEHALGIGVVLGTADKGYALNVKGLLIVTFPDITILLQARANFLKKRPDVHSSEEGALDALLVYASGQSTLTLDIVATWGIPQLLSVETRARAFFSFADPNAWYLEIGRDESGERAVAKVLKWNGDWLFNAGSWFRLDRTGVVTGVKVEVSLEGEKGGFWVRAEGHARGTMTIFWEPSQWEGSLAMSGSISAGYRSVSVSIELGGNARARVKRPFDVLVEVDACVDLKLKKVCKSFDFDWKESLAPQIESPIRRFTAKPRHFTPYPSAAAGSDGQEHGVVSLVPDTPAAAAAAAPVWIHPHSVLSLDFGKPMVDATAAFNEAIELDDGGFLTVGKKSGWSAAYRVDAVEVRRDPDGANVPVELWGTWAAETLERNTTLRLLSSERFGEEGSLTNTFAEVRDLDYCDEAKNTVLCVPLADVRPGYGWLEDGSLYYFPADPARANRLTQGVAGSPVTLVSGERIEVLLPRSARNVRVAPARAPTPARCPPPARTPSRATGLLARLCTRACPRAGILLLTVLLAFLSVLLFVLFHTRGLLAAALVLDAVAVVLSFLGWICDCHCRRDEPGRPNGGMDDGGEPPSPPTTDPGTGGSPTPDGPDTPTGPGPGGGTSHPGTPLDSDPDGVVVVDEGTTEGQPLGELCYEPGHGTSSWTDLAIRGGSKTDKEAWSVPPEMQVFAPGATYELRVSHTALLKKSDGTITTPLGAPAVTCARFQTLGPPDREDALRDYVASVVPSDGSRPVYTGYDVSLTFLEPYVPYLYVAVGEALCLRLRDGQGRPVAAADGAPLLIPVPAVGAVEKTVTLAAWEELYRQNVAEGCVAPDPVLAESENTLVVPAGTAPGYSMSPNSQYVVELVSSGRPEIALMRWGFTTSSFATFTELVTRGRGPAATREVPAVAGQTFEDLARSASEPTVRYVDRFTLTRLVDATGAGLALLLEAPEPLGAGSRLEIKVGGTDVTVVPNVDGTRVFVLPTAGSWAAGSSLILQLMFARDIGSAGPRLTVAGDATAEVVEIVVTP
jgi:hypothetical protein